MSQPLDLLVVGSGVAGLSAAVRAAAEPGVRVGVLSKAALAQTATRWAQGGVAAVLHADEDSTDLHLADTLAAGAGLCDPDAVRVLVDEGPARVHELIALGAVFDRDHHGRLLLAREGGHSQPRVVHAGGAATGAEIERALVDAVLETAAVVHERWFAVDLLVEGGRCAGLVALDPAGGRHEIRATHTLLASGGAGQLYSVTTNPLEATGDGIAMALRAGVAVADVEFVQFHPTALHHPAMPRPLLSEALRGHGAVLRDAAGERFIDELAPRDVVARAMTARILEQGVEHMWLDVAPVEDFARRFPTIHASLVAAGLDPEREWLPVAPAAHYVCGGVLTDLDGATTLPGLWACGEVACTGVHGANRLASNSLLEGMVFAPRVLESIAAGRDSPRPTGALRGVVEGAGGPPAGAPAAGGHGPGAGPEVETTLLAWRRPPAPREGCAADAGALRARLQQAMTAGAGLLRSAASLEACGGDVDEVAAAAGGDAAASVEVRNLALVARALLAAATARHETRGAHSRMEYPNSDPAYRRRLVLR